MTKHCPKCGKTMGKEDEFCEHCGAKLGKIEKKEVKTEKRTMSWGPTTKVVVGVIAAIIIGFFVIVFLSFLLSGTTGPKCTPPYIVHGESCCLDADYNEVCDSDETLPIAPEGYIECQCRVGCTIHLTKADKYIDYIAIYHFKDGQTSEYSDIEIGYSNQQEFINVDDVDYVELVNPEYPEIKGFIGSNDITEYRCDLLPEGYQITTSGTCTIVHHCGGWYGGGYVGRSNDVTVWIEYGCGYIPSGSTIIDESTAVPGVRECGPHNTLIDEYFVCENNECVKKTRTFNCGELVVGGFCNDDWRRPECYYEDSFGATQVVHTTSAGTCGD